MKKIEAKLDALVNYVTNFYKSNSYMPSIREIADSIGVKSTSTISYYMDILIERGIFEKKGSTARAYHLKSEFLPVSSNSFISLPLISDVKNLDNTSAGISAKYDLPKSLFDVEDSFITTISGESMIDVGIMDGDYVIVHKQCYAENGDIVIAIHNDKPTCKRYFRDREKIRLQPENTTMEPIYVNNCEIVGKVTGVIRNKIY